MNRLEHHMNNNGHVSGVQMKDVPTCKTKQEKRYFTRKTF
jgi:hypothetical protein